MKTYHAQSAGQKVPVWLAFAIPALLALLGGIWVVAASCQQGKPALTKLAKPKLPMPVADFKALVVGRTQEEVSDLLGTPADTGTGDNTSKEWLYRDVATDPDTGKTKKALLHFDHKGGRWVCVRITFF